MIEIQSIHKAISRYYDIDPKDIFIKRKFRPISDKRMMFFYLSRLLTHKTCEFIGNYPKKITGESWNYCSVIHAFNTMDNLIRFDKNLKKDAEEIKIICEKFKSVDEKVNNFKQSLTDIIYAGLTEEEIVNNLLIKINDIK